MARTSAQRSTSSVIRTYAAADRASAERSFQREREQAAGRGWEPVSQRWRTEGREQVLTVVYETRDARTGVAWADSPAGDTRTVDARPGVARSDDARSAVADRTRPVPWDELRALELEASRGVVETLDLHCAGEPLRLIRSGFPARAAAAHH